MTDYTSDDNEQRLLNNPEYAQAWVEQEGLSAVEDLKGWTVDEES